MWQCLQTVVRQSQFCQPCQMTNGHWQRRQAIARQILATQNTQTITSGNYFAPLTAGLMNFTQCTLQTVLKQIQPIFESRGRPTCSVHGHWRTDNKTVVILQSLSRFCDSRDSKAVDLQWHTETIFHLWR